MSATFQGRRRPDQRPGDLPDDIRPGDYWKRLDADGQPLRISAHASNLTGAAWAVVAPASFGWALGNLEAHTVREHEDGTISVRPGDGSSNSILIPSRRNRPDGKGGWLPEDESWHGYIEHGEWRAC